MTIAKARRAHLLASYDDDVLLWSQQQAQALRERRFADLDIEHLADEIEDVGKSETREVASRFAVLLAHLLKWRLQPERRGNSWRLTILDQRRRIERALNKTPSLRTVLADPDWQEEIWLETLTIAQKETGLERDVFPDAPPFSLAQARDPDFWPD